ncbi:hypothetical protein RV15_GL003189 [Enterococcus silesiacus]|uniref:Uncharacterized protein n=1 Tax=Enterococcus silesiacus TaxID=332949 RepID=A0AA91GFP3_9ENTE|nr:hypothetical protein RV15_GL003189 [Enterococcus silesiacus]
MTAKDVPAIVIVPQSIGILTTAIKIGIINILITVNLFGKFNACYPSLLLLILRYLRDHVTKNDTFLLLKAKQIEIA